MDWTQIANSFFVFMQVAGILFVIYGGVLAIASALPRTFVESPRDEPGFRTSTYPSVAEMEALIDRARLARSREVTRLLHAFLNVPHGPAIARATCATGLFVFLVAVAFANS